MSFVAVTTRLLPKNMQGKRNEAKSKPKDQVSWSNKCLQTCKHMYIYIYIIFMDYQHTNNYGDYQLVTTNWFVLCFIFWHLSFNQETVEVVQARVATDMSVPILCQKMLGEKFHGEISIAPPKTEMDTPPKTNWEVKNEGSEDESPWKKGWFSSCTLVLEKVPKINGLEKDGSNSTIFNLATCVNCFFICFPQFVWDEPIWLPHILLP